mmetsp:Transcript_13072/g.54755  ORF Transcript_13072/g.54755 Transcript_13072/m.54755 type:complete len:232 (-) Transcript_13072:4226-4921(-)
MLGRTAAGSACGAARDSTRRQTLAAGATIPVPPTAASSAEAATATAMAMTTAAAVSAAAQAPAFPTEMAEARATARAGTNRTMRVTMAAKALQRVEAPSMARSLSCRLRHRLMSLATAGPMESRRSMGTGLLRTALDKMRKGPRAPSPAQSVADAQRRRVSQSHACMTNWNAHLRRCDGSAWYRLDPVCTDRYSIPVATITCVQLHGYLQGRSGQPCARSSCAQRPRNTRA